MKNYKIITVILLILSILWWWFLFLNNKSQNNDNALINTSSDPIIIKDWDKTYSYNELSNGIKWSLKLNFNLSNDLMYIENYINLEKISIDFDWDWKIDKEYLKDENISFNYSRSWTYKLSWTYIWKDKITWKLSEMEIKLPIINIK